MHTGMSTHTHTHTDADTHAPTHTDTQTQQRHTHRDTGTHTNKHTDTQTHRDTQTHTDIDTNTHTETQAHTQTHTPKSSKLHLPLIVSFFAFCWRPPSPPQAWLLAAAQHQNHWAYPAAQQVLSGAQEAGFPGSNPRGRKPRCSGGC